MIKHTKYNWCKRENMDKRAVLVAEYIVEHEATVRSAANAFGISKSTVHVDIRKRLYPQSQELYDQAVSVLMKNKAERHIRGGIATQRKYKQVLS